MSPPRPWRPSAGWQLTAGPPVAGTCIPPRGAPSPASGRPQLAEGRRRETASSTRAEPASSSGPRGPLSLIHI
eukprot:5211933-Alexandrium_andersonii.AAC.1